VTEHSPNDVVSQALIVSRLRAWRTALLALHKILVDAELLRYGAAHSPVGGPHHALRLLTDDPWFQWLRPMLVLVVQIDERLAEKRAITTTELEAFRRETRALLQSPADTPSGREYQRSLQELPTAVVVHGKLLEMTRDEAARP